MSFTTDDAIALISKLPKVQVGTVPVPFAAHPTGNGWTEIGPQYVPFANDPAFVRAPQVTVSIAKIESYQTSSNVAIWVEVVPNSITSSGFTLSIKGAFQTSLSQVVVSWVASGV